MKYKLIALILAALLVTFCGCSLKPAVGSSSSLPQESSENTESFAPVFTVTALNVGKADCLLLRTADCNILIDTGEPDTAQNVVDFLKDQNVQTINYLIITHFHLDHCGAAAEIIKKFDVQNILQPDYKGEEDETAGYDEAVENAGIIPYRISDDYKFTADGISFTVSPADKKGFSKLDDNDRSLITNVVCGSKTFLFMGDCGRNRLNSLLKDGVSHYDFLKVPHHGFQNESSQIFLSSVSPQFAVITNKRSGISTSIINTLKTMGTETLIADEQIPCFLCDGESIVCKYLEPEEYQSETDSSFQPSTDKNR